jgi:endonuclease/exonuclease/phosphatase (EEP) superfamily protein YafD
MNAATWVDLQVNNKKFRIYNAHLESINLSNEDLEFMKESVPVRQKRPRLTTLSKFRDAFEIRATQARELKRHAEGVEWPVIISGDFNDTPISYTFRTLSSGRSNAFRESGWGFSKSHTSIPFLCIDYILGDPQIHFQKFQKIKVDYSDHYPLVAEFSIE